MLFNTPQYIEIEDKIAGPLTAKQLMWMFGMGAALLVLWGILDQMTFIISAIPVAGIFCAFAFYKPQGQPLIKFIVWGLFFVFRPKFYIWRRDYEKKKKRKEEETHEVNDLLVKKQKNQKTLAENIEGFAKTLDSEGKERSEKIMEIINKNRGKR
jgi:hypothetical protein